MLDRKKTLIVLDFELRDAVRSRLVLFVVLLFAAGAALGAFGFINSVHASEEAARDLLARQAGVPKELIAMDQIRGQALEGLISFVGDPELRTSLLQMDPLAIFFGYMSQLLVPWLVLFLSAGAHAADIASGGTRFVLFRADRATWAVGKLFAQGATLALGLLVAAVVTAGCALYAQPGFSSDAALAVLISAARAWVLGCCYLGWFAGVALLLRAPMKARALSLASLILASVGHLVTASDWAQAQSPALALGRWLFPAQYKALLWKASPLAWGSATLALLVLGGLGFCLGLLAYQRRDA